MVSPLNIVLNTVDLQSYSKSGGFLGFFERKAKFSVEVCDLAVDLVFNSSLFDVSALCVVSNLFVVGDDANLKAEYDLGDRELVDHIRALASKDLLTRKGRSEDCWPLLEGEHLSERQGIPIPVLRTLFGAVMSVDGIRGHCFGVALDRGLIVYAHDDSGFGFISTSKMPMHRKSLQSNIVTQFGDTNEFRLICPPISMVE